MVSQMMISFGERGDGKNIGKADDQSLTRIGIRGS